MNGIGNVLFEKGDLKESLEFQKKALQIREEIDDVKASTLARDISNEIKQKLNFPGQIKVIVIRETRSIQMTGDFN